MAASNMLQFLSFSVLIAITAIVFGLFNVEQPQPYMDEIFHIPQARNYCVGNLSHWNSKITTLPGLYLVSLILLRISNFLPFIRSALDADQPCSILFLRFINLLFMIGNFWLLYELSMKINSNYQIKEVKNLEQEEHESKTVGTRKKKSQKVTVDNKAKNISAESTMFSDHCFANALVLSLFPLLYFFTFLYYTDQGSTLMVFVTYWFSLQDSHVTAALTGAVATCFRQTNIIWVAFVAGNALLHELDDLPAMENGIHQFMVDSFYAVRQKIEVILQKMLPYALTGVAFCIFVVKNNGIVVGDRSSHQACFNLPQVLYFIGFTMAFSFPLFFSILPLRFVKNKLQECLRTKTGCFTCLIGIIIIVLLTHHFTYVHEYLLADNRHYTFYIWRKLFQRHWIVKFVVIPCYIYGALVIYQQLHMKNSAYFVLLLAISISLVTVPQKLLEFRYFLIPYLLFRLHVPMPSYLSLSLEATLYLIVNCFTIFLFLYKPFYWNNSSDIQRFMW